MRILRLSSFAALLSIGCLLSGCFGQGRSSSQPDWDEKAKKPEQQAQAPGGAQNQPAAIQRQPADVKETTSTAAEKLLDKILKGITDNDYSLYSKDFTEPLKLVIPAGKFAEDVKDKKNKIGDYVSRAFLTELVKGDRRICLWKAKFSKTEDDILIRLVIEKDGEAYKVSSLWIQ